MKIKDKIKLDREGLTKEGPINIVAFGDSVTHGAVGPGEIDYETVYWNRLRQKINKVRSYMPVNVINAGIGGITAKGSVDRVESQVLSHSPDLVIVCFGLNDVNGSLREFLASLRAIFEKCTNFGTEVIYMTPNMLNTYVSEDTEETYKAYAQNTAELQNGGKMDTFMTESVKLAKDMGITVCDCYSRWKKLSETEDTTLLLANRINHPTREMHSLFADMLFEVIFNDTDISVDTESTMYRTGE